MQKLQKTENSKGLLNLLQGADRNEFRPVVFWSINSSLEQEELVRQIREMRAFGLGGFVFHARAGMTTEYLSEEWFRLVGVCLKEAAAQGLQVWVYDEFGWPSGFVGGKLLQARENRARYLEYAVLDRYDEKAYAVYALHDGVPRLLRPGERAAEYHTLYLRYSDAYVDILNPAVTDQFIEATYRPYYERFGDRFGKELLGFFTDEPQYYRYAPPISAVTEEAFLRTYGEPLKEGLLYLFLQTERAYPFRVRYYNLMNRLYCENYYRRLYDWCQAHGCRLTGHSVEETLFFTQMWGGADCATSYLYEHIPAIDNLAKHSPAYISAKNVGSAAAQTGKPLVMTETFGCSSYGVTPRELRLIGDKQYVFGVDLMCQHLYNYSLAGQGKIDHPVSFGRTLPWIEGYPALNRYFADLGYLIASSQEETPVAVVTPMESIYLDYLRLDEEAARENVDVGFSKIVSKLRANGIAYQFVNEKILQDLGRAENGRLIVGERTYAAVLLANCRELKQSTVRLLTEMLEQGGKLAIEGSIPAFVDGFRTPCPPLRANIGCEELPRPAAIRALDADYTLRRLPNGTRFLFAVNESDQPVQVQLNERFCAVDLESGIGYAAQDRFTIPPQSSLLAEEDGPYTRPPLCARRSVTVTPKFCGSDRNNLTIEDVRVTLEDGTVLCGYAYGIYETLVKRGYTGVIRVAFRFESDAAREIWLTAEKQDVRAERFNGESITFVPCAEDVNFRRAHLQARPGENVYEYTADLQNAAQVRAVLFESSVPESLRNCFSYSTYMEPIYIGGRFDVREGRLTAETPKTAGDLTAQGMENFCGVAEYSFETAAEGRVCLRPIGHFSMCEFRCEDRRAIVLLNETAEMDLGRGNHRLTVRVYSTMRNRFGPFHYAGDEELGVSPDCFTLRGNWTDEHTNPLYDCRRRLVPFGLESVEISY